MAAATVAADLMLGAPLAGQATPLVNGDFETGDFTGWTLFTTANGTTGTPVVTPFDTNDDTVETNSAQFEVGKVGFSGPAGGGIYQNVNLAAGSLSISVDIAADVPGGRSNVQGGIFDLLLDGVVVDTHSFGDIGSGVTEHSMLADASVVSAGLHELRIRITRPFTVPGNLYQYVDNVVISGTSTVTAPEPASVALLGLALAGLGIRRRRAARAV